MSDRFVIPSRSTSLPRRGAGGTARGGIVDLVLVVLAVVAMWGRTPVVELGKRGVSWVVGSEYSGRSLTDFFLTGPDADEVMDLLANVDVDSISQAGPVLPEGALPEPWRTAALMALSQTQPGAVVPEDIAAMPSDLRTVALLDHLYEDDPRIAIEQWVLGRELVERAVRRAELSGVEDPRAYRAHRRFLPSEERTRADRYVEGALALATVLQMQWPVSGEHRISSPYGERVHPTTGARKFHNGVDLAVKVGTPVRSTQQGVVAMATEDDLNGKYVIIDHGAGVRTSYCHLSQLDVTRGQGVERGELIALSGNTGRSTGPHLHFVLRVGKSTVDPMRMHHTAHVADEVPSDPGEEEPEVSGG